MTCLYLVRVILLVFNACVERQFVRVPSPFCSCRASIFSISRFLCLATAQGRYSVLPLPTHTTILAATTSLQNTFAHLTLHAFLVVFGYYSADRQCRFCLMPRWAWTTFSLIMACLAIHAIAPPAYARKLPFLHCFPDNMHRWWAC